ncbi:MAG: glycosyltransferase [Acidobacteriaceae bacterium]|nr:glycosyltransferase [Acidobacteriaceae bacterium]
MLQLPSRLRLLRQARLIVRSGLFDSAFYLQHNPDVRRGGIRPPLHYLMKGASEGRDPHALFDTDWYLQQNPEVAASGANPLVDYLVNGWKLGRNPHPLFDAALYLEQNPDVEESAINPLFHYLKHGAAEGRDPNSFFDSSFYLSRYPDVAASGMNPLAHYASFGVSEGRLPNQWSNLPWPRTLPIIDGKEAWDQYGMNRLRGLLSSSRELTFPRSDSVEASVILVFHNKAHLSLLCLESLRLNADREYEVIIVDNNSTDQTSALLDRCRNAKIIRNARNLGFGEACMMGAGHAQGKYLFFLNNDVLLEPRAMGFALQNFENEAVGAVGGRILLANGDLQEAGSMIWSDGSAHGYGRLDRPDLPQYGFRRPVDFCSAALLFTPRDLFFRLGGFDPIYSPAYYEDTDYCVKIWQAGLRVIYEPQCVIRHFESASSGGNESARPMIAANQHKFVSRWKDMLSGYCSRSMHNVIRARIANQSKGLKILYMDDRVPHRSLGAGFPRSNDILHQLTKQGHHVTCASMDIPLESAAIAYRDIAPEVELVDGTESWETLRDHISTADVIWISRPNNLAFFLDRVMEFDGLEAKLVYDAEAIFSDRDRLHAELRNRFIPSKILDARLKRELDLARAADAVIVVCLNDKAAIEGDRISNVHVLSHAIEARPTPASFRDRYSFLFIGAVHGPENPNADSIRYFCSEIWPEVHCHTGAELVVAGFGTDQYLTDIRQRGVRIVGPMDDLTSAFNEARVFIAPTRYSAGIPFKVHEAAGNGVPAVVSQLIGRQLSWDHEIDVLVAEDRTNFSTLCCRLYSDQKLWEQIRANALSRVHLELDPAAFAGKIAAVLASLDKVN